MPKYAITITMTPRQAAYAADVLQRVAGSYSAFHSKWVYGAEGRIDAGLIDAGYRWDSAKKAWAK